VRAARGGRPAAGFRRKDSPPCRRADRSTSPAPCAPCATIVGLLLGTPAPVGGRSVAAQSCFPETGKCVEGRFLDYWNAHGGLAINGFPLSDERQEKIGDTTYWVQWFERVRMEYHPEYAGTPSEVLLGQFGRAIHPADPPVAPMAVGRFFPETGHNVPPDFLAYWTQNGGLPDRIRTSATFPPSPATADSVCSDFAADNIDAFLIHVGEGTSPAVRNELKLRGW